MANASSVPPYSEDAEKSTLGSILIDKDSVIQVLDLINEKDFYYDKHQMIFQAIRELSDKNIPIDILTLSSHLEDKKLLEKVGSSTYLAELATVVPTSTHIIQYAQIVKHKSTLRKLIQSGQLITGLGYDESEDIEDLMEQAEKSLFGVSQTFLKNKFIPIKEILAGTYEKISELHDPETKEKYSGITSGFNSIDKILCGFQRTDLIILAARPSMGKTALALNIAQNIAQKGMNVGIISLEMGKEQLVERMFCSLLQVDSWKLRTGRLSEEDFQRIGGVMDKLNSMNIFIDDSAGSNFGEVRAKIRRLKMEHGLDYLIIDYLQLLSTGKSAFNANRVAEISEISRSLKILARELHIPILALSQLSRNLENRHSKIPQLSDLRDSGAIEQDADVVMMMYREDYYEEDSERAGLVDLYIKKHRNGPIGNVELRFHKEQMKFLDVDKTHKPNVYLKQRQHNAVHPSQEFKKQKIDSLPPTPPLGEF